MQQCHQNSACPSYTDGHPKQRSSIKRENSEKEWTQPREFLHPPLFQIVFGLHRVVSRRTESGYKGGKSTPMYKSTLCSVEVEPGRSFIAEVLCTSSHLSWLMRDTSGYWKTISVVCKFSLNHEQDGVFWWRWDCSVLHRKKALCLRKQKSDKRFKLLYPPSVPQILSQQERPLGQGGGSSRLRGLQVEFQLRRQVARIRKNRLCQAASLARLCTPGTVLLAYPCPATWLQRTQLLLQTAQSYHSTGAPGSKPGRAGWTGTHTGANLRQARSQAKWGSKTYPSAHNFEIFNKSTKFNSDEWNVFVDERPKKCSWQSFLKVLEEHLKGAKSK